MSVIHWAQLEAVNSFPITYIFSPARNLVYKYNGYNKETKIKIITSINTLVDNTRQYFSSNYLKTSPQGASFQAENKPQRYTKSGKCDRLARERLIALIANDSLQKVIEDLTIKNKQLTAEVTLLHEQNGMISKDNNYSYSLVRQKQKEIEILSDQSNEMYGLIYNLYSKRFLRVFISSNIKGRIHNILKPDLEVNNQVQDSRNQIQLE